MWRHSQSGNLANSTIWKLHRTFRTARQRQTGPRQIGARLKHARDTCQIAPPICQSGLRLASLPIWQSGEAIWPDYFRPPDGHNHTTASQQSARQQSARQQLASSQFRMHSGIRAERCIRASGHGDLSGHLLTFNVSCILAMESIRAPGQDTYPGKRAMRPSLASGQCSLSGQTGNASYPGERAIQPIQAHTLYPGNVNYPGNHSFLKEMHYIATSGLPGYTSFQKPLCQTSCRDTPKCNMYPDSILPGYRNFRIHPGTSIRASGQKNLSWSG